MSGENTPDKQKLGPPWKPGQSGNPKGRPKGARSKLGEAFIEAMHEDFQAHGKSVIETVRVEKPDQYLKVIASILPKELNVKTEALDELDDSELAGLLEAVRSVTTELAAREARAGGQAEEVREQAEGLRPIH